MVYLHTHISPANMHRFVKRAVKRAVKRTKPILNGRWNRKKPMVQLDLANHDHSEYKYVHTQYDNSMDVALCALQSLHIPPKNADPDDTQ